ncbi:MAG: tetratricopeptide repeat protein [Alphaproteobacteria bacterium]
MAKQSPALPPALILRNLADAERLIGAERLDDALAVLDRIAAAAANSPELHRLRGEALGRKRDMTAALRSFERAVRLAPGAARYRAVLAQHLRHMGDHPQAIRHLGSAAGLEPPDPELKLMLADWLVQAGEAEKAKAEAEAVFGLATRNPDLILRACEILDRAGALTEAIAGVEMAARLRPDDPLIRQTLRRLYSRAVPAWHFPMMNDTARNAAYQAAIQRAVGPDTHVLDIGCGAGLLSLLAAGAGARRVTAIEANATIAAAAADVMERNGVADRVKVIPKVSTACRVGADVDQPADLLVHEILSDAVLGEYVIATLRHARQHLLKPGAQLIPHTISAMGALIGGETLMPWLYVDTVSGFDMSPFNRFVSDVISIRLDDRTYVIQSEAVEIFRFDLRVDTLVPQQRTVVFTATVPGPCCGVVLWNRLHLDAETSFDNRPHPGAIKPSAWAHVLYPLPAPVRLGIGDKIAISATHDTVALHLAATGTKA